MHCELFKCKALVPFIVGECVLRSHTVSITAGDNKASNQIERNNYRTNLSKGICLLVGRFFKYSFGSINWLMLIGSLQGSPTIHSLSIAFVGLQPFGQIPVVDQIQEILFITFTFFLFKSFDKTLNKMTHYRVGRK